MKVMIVAPYFHPRVGGMEIYVYNIARLLAQKYGVQVVIVCSNWSREEYIEEIIDGMKVYRLPYLFKVSATPINPFWQREITSVIVREKPDVINGHTPVPYIADVACRIAYRKKIPFVLTYQNDLMGYNALLKLLSNFYYYWLGFKTLRLSQKIIVTSEYYAKSSPYIKNFAAKFEIVPPGVDIQKFEPAPYSAKDDKIVLFIGQLNKANQHKGLNYLIKAIKIVSDTIEDAQLVIVGKGDYIHHYKNLVRTLEIQDKVKFAGFVQDEDLPRYYSESTVVALPSYSRAEGYGIVLIEAQACGKPAIGTTVGGIPCAIRDGETGLLVPPRDPEKLAEAIIRILSDSKLAQQLGQAGYKRVRKELTWEKSAEKTLKVYEGLI